MRGAVQFGGLEQADVIGTAFVAHEIVDVPGRRRRAPGEILGRDDDVEAAPGADKVLFALLPFGRVQQGPVADAEGACASSREKTTRPAESRRVM